MDARDFADRIRILFYLGVMIVLFTIAVLAYFVNANILTNDSRVVIGYCPESKSVVAAAILIAVGSFVFGKAVGRARL